MTKKRIYDKNGVAHAIRVGYHVFVLGSIEWIRQLAQLLDLMMHHGWGKQFDISRVIGEDRGRSYCQQFLKSCIQTNLFSNKAITILLHIRYN